MSFARTPTASRYDYSERIEPLLDAEPGHRDLVSVPEETSFGSKEQADQHHPARPSNGIRTNPRLSEAYSMPPRDKTQCYLVASVKFRGGGELEARQIIAEHFLP